MIVIIFIVSNLDGIGTTREEISYPELLKAIEENKVERIQTVERAVYGLYKGSHISEKDFLSGGKYDFRSRIITGESFYEDIKNRGQQDRNTTRGDNS